MRLLYLEDDPRDADLVRSALAADTPGAQVEVVATLEQARACLRGSNSHDAVLTRVHSGEGPGVELIREIRQLKLPVAVVALIEDGDAGLVLSVLKAGADGYLSRSDDLPRRLPRTLRAALARWRDGPARSTRTLRVLYADRDPVAIDLTARHFERAAPHLQLYIVHDAAAALAHLPRQPSLPPVFDIVLLDHRLTGDNGLELLRALRDDCGLDHPLVMLIGEDSEELVAHALRLGATDCIVKRDHYLDALPALLDNACHRVQAARQQAALQRSEERLAGLEARLRERTAELQQALRTADSASRAKGEFLSHMSHELRTPMNAILGFAQIIEISEPTPRQLKWAGEIRRAGSHLLLMIEDLLDLARVEVGKINIRLEVLEIEGILAESLAIVEPLIEARGLRLVQDLGQVRVPVRADRLRLRQVLVNLLSNAAKYNRDRGTITMRCQQLGDRLRLSVADEGMGIAPNKLAHLFQPFDRLGAEHGKVEGTGIGLALSSQLARLMDAELGVDSSQGVGSTFWIDLPIAPADRPDAPAAAPPEQARAKTAFDVLYVEDNESNVEVIAAFMAQQPNVRLATAGDGPAGLALARANRPDIILLDIHLPGPDGYEVLAQLRADPQLRATPVVALSADAMPYDIQRGLSAGFDRYLAKPVDLAELLQTLHGLLPARVAGP